MRAQGQPGPPAEGPRRTLQVDARSQGSGRSPSASPERGSTPTSPYSLPQIAPLPSSTLCPICKTTELTSSPGQPNFNACTQCHSKVCNQCGFNPNPHLTQVKEWLCLNCQMQRALGMDMTTAPRSKSQQQLHSPSPSPSHSPAKHPPPPTADKSPPAARALPSEPPKPHPTTPQREPHGQGQPKPQEAARSSPQHQQAKPSSSEQRKTTGDTGMKPAAPAPGAGAQEQAQEGLTGKLFGFGASLLTQASTLMSVQPEAPAPSQPSPGKVPPKIVFSDASKEAGPKAPGAQGRAGATPAAKLGKPEQGVKPKEVPKARVSCPLCKAEINVGSGEPPNYNTCTTCRQQVCNMCGFNPTPHLVEKNEWLCLNCQTQRLLEGSLGDPAPMPLPAPKQPPTGSPRHQPPAAAQQQRAPAPAPAEPAAPPERQPSPARSLRAAEQSRTPSPAPAEKKPLVPAEEKPLPKAAPEPSRAPESAAPKAKSVTPKPEVESKESRAPAEAPRAKEQEDGSKPYPPDLSRSPQSLSDTGYSSDGISSSQSEITGLVQQEEEKLSGTGLAGQSPPSPSELTKLESSMRPLLEGRSAPPEPAERGKSCPEPREEQRQRQRPRYLSITPEAFDSDEELEDILEEDEDSLEWENQRERRESAESSDEFGSKLRHDYVEDSSEGGFSPVPPRPKGREAEVSDEEFMRRQILEMSAEEDNLEEEEEEEGYRRAKYSIPKTGQKAEAEKGKEPASAKRRLPPSPGSLYKEERKELEAAESDDLSTAQGGLRRFKTIELNSTTGYGREMEMGQEVDTSLDREPELEMESLTGSPEERSRGEYSSTLPATTPSYTSGTSPTSISSLEEDSDSSPSRRQRLEEVKQQRKARHRSHGPLLPTIEDSSEEEELREEEELLREQEKMREVEQQRIRSTARKTKRDKEELRAQRRRERSKTPPSNLSPIEDASPTEELRQAAEMEELHRSSCSEYSPSIDSEAESFEAVASKLYKSGSEYNLPTFMSLYSPTEKADSGPSQPASKPLKSAEEAYEEMMRKAEMMQKQQVQQAQPAVSYGGTYQQAGYRGTEGQNGFEYQYAEEYRYEGGPARPSQPGYPSALPKAGAVYEEILQTSQSIARMHQSSSFDLGLEQGEKGKVQEETYQEKRFLNAESAYADLMKQNGGPLTPGTSPTQLSAPVSFATSEGSTGKAIPDVRVTQHFTKEGQDLAKLQSTPAVPSPVTKAAAAPYAYGKGTSPVTTAAGGPGSTTRSYSSSAPEASSVAGRSYGPVKSAVSYGSQTEDASRSKAAVEISVQTAREKLPAVSDGKPPPPKTYPFFKSSSPPLSPTSPTQSPTRTTKATAEFSTQTQSPLLPYEGPAASGPAASSPMVAQGTQTPHRTGSPRLARQPSSQDAPSFMVITLAADAASQTKPASSGSLTSPTSSPTRPSRQLPTHGYSQAPEPEQPAGTYIRAQPVKEHAQKPPAVTSAADGITGLYGWGALPAENISLCRISSVPGTSRVEPGPKAPSTNAVDLRTALKSAPIIITDQGMDLTSLATEARKYCLTLDHIPSRQSTAIQPLIINLNAQEQPHAIIAAASTAGLAIASPMLLSQPKQPVVYGDPFQSRVDFGQGTGSPVCLAQVKQVEQGVQTAAVRASGVASSKPEPAVPSQTKFARYGVPGQVVKKDVLMAQTGGAQNVGGLPQSFPPEPGSELYRAVPVELKSQSPLLALGGKKSQVMMVQMEEAAAGPVTKVLKEEPPANVLDLTGVKPESQVACCDVVYKFPFGGSCTGAFNPTSKMPEKKAGEAVAPGRKPSGPLYGSREPELPETFPYREQPAPAPALYEEQKFYPAGAFGRLYSSMSDTNLSEIGMSYYPMKGDQPFPSPAGDAAVDLSTMKHSYSVGFAEGGYLGHGLQYGSFSDLRQPAELLGHPLPMRRYSSASNIYSDYRFSPRGDLASFQESSLAHYSATTAREISRMCAALNSMDQYGGRHANGPDLLPYGPGAGPGGTGGLAAQQQGPAPPKPGGMYNPTFPEARQGFGSLAQYNVPGVRLGAVRQMFPSTATVRAADGMIYSTINTPIASTLPITTQPASVLRPMLRGLYRPYGPGGVAAVPLASLARLPVVTPRVPLAAQGLYRYPAPGRPAPAASLMETPVYLGKPVSTAPAAAGAGPAPKAPTAPAGGLQRAEPAAAVPRAEGPAAPAAGKEGGQAATVAKPPPDAAQREEREREEERQRKQQEHVLQLERERVELEKLRQLRLQEELERERAELQRHREKEQLLVQRELQELQCIKQQASAEGKSEGATRGTASVGIQTISDCSVQTEPDQLLRVSPSIHITTHDPRVEIVKYISAPEKTQRGESLACQTEPEPAPQPGVVVPQLTVPTTIPPYSTNIQMVSTGPLDPHAVRQQTLGKFEKKKPDPLEIGYQSHLPAESLSQLVTRQPPRSPQVLYSPVSPLSPHRLLESSFATSERLNKAHVPPQKHFTADSAQRQQTLPRPIKTMQRSLSDPKPISPTAEEAGKDRFSLYQHPLLPGTQVGGLQSSPLARKVKRTLPSPPPEEPHVPLASPAAPQLYLSSLAPKATAPVTKASLLKELDRDLKLVEHEATKLRKKQAELDEEEKEIDAKLKYLELGITQRKESLLKERGGGRDHPYLRCPGDRRDYLSDSELHSLHLAAYDSAGLRPAPAGQYPDFAAAAATASYGAYPYPAPQGPAAFPPARLQPPQYPVASTSQDGLPAAQLPAFASPGAFPAPSATYPELGTPGQPGFRPQNPYQAPSAFAGVAAVPAAQPALFQSPAEVAGGHQKLRQTSLADLEQKIPTNYEVISAATSSSSIPDVTFSAATVSSGYEQYKAPEARPAERAGAAQGPSASFSSESLYTSLEQNIPRNYVMIEDISELTKESPAVEGQKAEPAGTGADGRHGREKSELGDADGSGRPCCYTKAEEESEEDIYDHHGPDHRGKNSYHRGAESNGRVSVSSASSSYYYGDGEYRHSSRVDKHSSGAALPKHSSKNLAPAVVSSKRSKHRKQGMEQKISKFSPIEEAKDVESDLASYTVTTSVGSSNVASRAKKLQEEITYGLKKNVYEQQKYYGVSSRDLMDEEERIYSAGSRTRSSGYGVEKSSVREVGGRSKSYEREGVERSQKGGSKPSSLGMSQSRGRAPMRTQPSEEESPVSPLGKAVGGSRAVGGPGPQSAGDPCSQFCSSHSLPDVQEHIKDVPRSHSYKHEEGYGMDDAHCVVSDSEAYHLGQEETDWFDKPREARAERVRHYGGHSSSQKRPPVKHTYHDYDEPPDEDPWQHDDYPQHREH
ncbi:BSN protein, partial [Lophotis ruficrista]|nr:BSN protein [Lophotis ruficrista]